MDKSSILAETSTMSPRVAVPERDSSAVVKNSTTASTGATVVLTVSGRVFGVGAGCDGKGDGVPTIDDSPAMEMDVMTASVA